MDCGRWREERGCRRHEFAGGKTLGDAKNVKLRFDPSYMRLAADGKL